MRGITPGLVFTWTSSDHRQALWRHGSTRMQIPTKNYRFGGFSRAVLCLNRICLVTEKLGGEIGATPDERLFRFIFVIFVAGKMAACPSVRPLLVKGVMDEGFAHCFS